MDEHAVLGVPGDGAGENRALDLPPQPLQVLDGVPVVHPLYVLLDDRAGVQLRGHIMGGRPDQLHAARVRLRVRFGPNERRQEAVMYVNDSVLPASYLGRRDDLHIAREDDGIHAGCFQNRLLPRLSVCLAVLCHGNVMKRNAERRDQRAAVGVVADNDGDLGAQVAGALLPEQLQKAVFLFGDEDPEPLRAGGEREAVLYPTRGGDLPREGIVQLLNTLRQVWQVEFDPLKELAAARVGGVLVGVNDIGAALEEEPGDGGDDPRLIGADDKKPTPVGRQRCGGHSDAYGSSRRAASPAPAPSCGYGSGRARPVFICCGPLREAHLPYTAYMPSSAWEPVHRGGHYTSPRFTEFQPASVPAAPGTDWESPVIECDAFERAVLSWNGAGQGRLEMRVRVGGAFSPYVPLVILDGMRPRSATSAEQPAAGEEAEPPLPLLDVDTLVVRAASGAAPLADAFQIRGTGGDLTGLRSLAVTHYRLDDRHYTAAPADGRAWGTTLAVPQRSQGAAEDPAIRGIVCSPTSVAMVLEFYGCRHRTIDVCGEAYDSGAEIYGNWPANTAAAVRLLGGGSWAAVVKMAGFDEMEREIAAGHPVIIGHQWQEGELTNAPIPRSNGHLIVCVGFTEEGDVVVNDPAAKPDAVQRTYLRREMYHTWQESASGIAYIIRPA